MPKLRFLLYVALCFNLYSLFLLSPVRAQWSTNFDQPSCSFTFSPSSSQTTGNAVTITASTGSSNILVLDINVSLNSQAVQSTSFNPPTPSGTLNWTNTSSTGTYNVSSNVINATTGNYGTCKSTYKIENPPTPPPSPPQCGANTLGKAYIWPSSGYCWMNWWDNRCTVSLYDWVNPFTMTNFYVKAHDNWNNWDWTVCDTQWGSWGLCTRNWSTGYSSQSIAFNNPYYTIGTKYSLIQRTINWNNQRVETELANTCVSGFRYQMPAPVLYGPSCISSPQTGWLITIQFPTSNPARPVTWVDISEDPNFSTFYNRAVPAGATWIDAPNGFNGYQGVSGPLTIQPGHTYYVRLYGSDNSGWSTWWFNGNYGAHSGVAITYLPLCATDGGWTNWSWSACPACGDNVPLHGTRSCTNPAPANGGTDCVGPSTWDTVCNIPSCPVNGGWSIPNGPVWNAFCQPSCGPGQKWRFCNNPTPAYGGTQCRRDDGSLTTPTNSLELQNCNLGACSSSWIQTSGGDVHSNTQISAPGGP